MNSEKGVINFLGLKRGIVGILSMVILVEMGERMAEQFLPIYLIAVGGGFITIGVLNGMDNLLSALYSFPGGYLSDKFGTKRALFFFNIMAIIGFSIVVIFPQWWALLVGAIFYVAWSAISLPATMDVVSKVLPKNKRTMGVTMHSIIRRFPMAIGPLIGGFCVDHYGKINGVRYAFMLAIAMTFVAIVFQQYLLEDDHQERKDELHMNPFKLFKEMSPSLRNLLVSDILIRFCEQIPYAFVVVWAMETITHGVSGEQFGVLRTVEMATAVLIYIPVAYFADKSGKKIFVTITFINFTLFPLVLMYCHSFVPLILAFILRGLKEFGEPTRKALIMDLAPENKKAAMFGLYYLFRDTVVSIAAFASGFLWILSPQTNLLTAFGFGALGTIWFALRGTDLIPSHNT